MKKIIKLLILLIIFIPFTVFADNVDMTIAEKRVEISNLEAKYKSYLAKKSQAQN